MKNAELRKQIEELKKDIYHLLKKGTWLEEQEAKFKWNYFFEGEFFSADHSKIKEFLASLKKAEPFPHIEDLRYAGFIHTEFGWEAGSVGFDHLSGNIVWPPFEFGSLNYGTSDEEAKKRSEEKKKEEPKKYPEGILSFSDGKEIFNQINFNHPVTYNQWVEAYMKLNIPIHSVINSKGEVFTVGGWFCSPFIKGDKKIESIQIFGSFEPVILVTYDGTRQINIEGATAISKKGPSWKDQIIAFRRKSDKSIWSKYVDRFKCGDFSGVYNLNELIDRPDFFEIFTVCNKAWIEFSVGDEVSNVFEEPNIIQGKIISFRILNDVAIMADFIAAPSCGIEILTKAEPKKEPLFTSEDGYPVYEDDYYYEIYVDGSGYSTKRAYSSAFYYKNHSAIRFSLRENAQKHIKEKKKNPLFKTEDGFDIFHNDSYYAVYHDTILPHIASGGITYGIPFKEKANAEKYLAENNKKNISWAELEEFILRATWNQNINTGKDFLMIYYEDFINRFKPKS